MSSGDSMCPCDLCGYPGHWERDCPSIMKREEARRLLEQAIGETRNATLREVAEWIDANATMDPVLIASHFRRLSQGEMKAI